jgi:hypothetical protein
MPSFAPNLPPRSTPFGRCCQAISRVISTTSSELRFQRNRKTPSQRSSTMSPRPSRLASLPWRPKPPLHWPPKSGVTFHPLLLTMREPHPRPQPLMYLICLGSPLTRPLACQIQIPTTLPSQTDILAWALADLPLRFNPKYVIPPTSWETPATPSIIHVLLLRRVIATVAHTYL